LVTGREDYPACFPGTGRTVKDTHISPGERAFAADPGWTRRGGELRRLPWCPRWGMGPGLGPASRGAGRRRRRRRIRTAASARTRVRGLAAGTPLTRTAPSLIRTTGSSRPGKRRLSRVRSGTVGFRLGTAGFSLARTNGMDRAVKEDHGRDQGGAVRGELALRTRRLLTRRLDRRHDRVAGPLNPCSGSSGRRWPARLPGPAPAGLTGLLVRLAGRQPGSWIARALIRALAIHDHGRWDSCGT